MRTVLHYSARCENAETRSLINDEATAQGADELAKDSVSNENKNTLPVIDIRLKNIDSNEIIYT